MTAEPLNKLAFYVFSIHLASCQSKLCLGLTRSLSLFLSLSKSFLGLLNRNIQYWKRQSCWCCCCYCLCVCVVVVAVGVHQRRRYFLIGQPRPLSKCRLPRDLNLDHWVEEKHADHCHDVIYSFLAKNRFLRVFNANKHIS